MYHLATVNSLTDRRKDTQTYNVMMPIDDMLVG